MYKIIRGLVFIQHSLPLTWTTYLEATYIDSFNQLPGLIHTKTHSSLQPSVCGTGYLIKLYHQNPWFNLRTVYVIYILDNLYLCTRFWVLYNNNYNTTPEDSLLAGNGLFQGTGVSVCTDGRRYLGCSDNFIESFISNQVQTWHDLLTNIAKSQPHAPFSAYIHGFKSKWTFFCVILPLPSHICFGHID